MEIHSRLNREIDYSPWVFGAGVLGAINRIVASSYALDHHIAVRIPLGAGATDTRRLINPSFNFLILTVAATGSPLAALSQTRITLEDGEVGRRYLDRCPIRSVCDRIGATTPLPIPLVHLKGRPLDLILTNESATALDFIEIVLRGLRF